MRHALESMEPVDYLGQGYYERWHEILEAELVERGIIGADELRARITELRDERDPSPPGCDDPEAGAGILDMIYGVRSPECEATRAPRFAAGDRVRSRNLHPVGHTRMPRYVRDKVGTIERVWGFHLLQDALPEGAVRGPEPVYNVRFEGRELWGEDAEPGQTLFIDLWESHLEAEDGD